MVTDKADADAILGGVSEEKKGAMDQITGRYLGLHDNATGSINLFDKTGKVILWSGEAGDRSLMFGTVRRGGEGKVAQRLVSDLKERAPARQSLGRNDRLVNCHSSRNYCQALLSSSRE